MAYCLENYIGLEDCGSTTPDSGLYLQDLPGIELRQVDEIANEDDVNYTGVWNKVQKRALARFQTDLRKAFQKKYNLKGVVQSLDIGKIIDTTTTVPASAQYRGGAFELNEATDEVVYSNFQVIFVQTIRIYVPGAETFNVKIYDLDTDEELFTTSVTTTTAGWKTVNVNDFFETAKRINIVYDCTSIDSVKLDIEDANVNCFPKCQGRLRGCTSPTGTPTDITYNAYNTHGLSVVLSVRCKYDVFVCNNKELFSQALLYLLGSELMREQMASSRTTRWTMLDNKQAKYMMKYFNAVYEGGVFDEVSYDGELPGAIDQVNLDSFDCCVDCIGDLSFQDSYL